MKVCCQYGTQKIECCFGELNINSNSGNIIYKSGLNKK